MVYLSAAYQGSNQLTVATSTLENHLLTNKENDRVRAILYLQNEADKALTNYQVFVQIQPESVLVNNNFAWLYMEKAVKAYKLTEGNSVNITLNYIEGLLLMNVEMKPENC